MESVHVIRDAHFLFGQKAGFAIAVVWKKPPYARCLPVWIEEHFARIA